MLANATMGGAHKPSGPKKKVLTMASYACERHIECRLHILNCEDMKLWAMMSGLFLGVKTVQDLRFCQISCNFGMMGGWGVI